MCGTGMRLVLGQQSMEPLSPSGKIMFKENKLLQSDLKVLGTEAETSNEVGRKPHIRSQG